MTSQVVFSLNYLSLIFFLGEIRSLKNIILAVEAKNCLDTQSDRDPSLNYFVKPPANLVVLEGDCLDSGGDAGELESYLVIEVLPFVATFIAYLM